MNRLERLRAAVPTAADCFLITDAVNRRYFTGMKSSAGTLAVFRDAAYLIIDGRYYEKAKSSVTGCEVVLQKKLYDQLGVLFSRHNTRRAAVEIDTVTLRECAALKKELPVKLSDGGELSDVINAMRMIKTPEEIAHITAAQRIAERAFAALLPEIRAGVTERALALKLDFLMLSGGAEALSFDTIALTGAATSMPHGVPSERVVKNGDFVLLDFGAVVNGYHSDMTRTVCAGEPTEKMRAVYDTVLAAQEAGLAAVRAGVCAGDADKAARDVIAKAGWGDCFGHSLGHGVGLEIHEAPNLTPAGKAVLAPGMVVTVEPGIYLPKEFGVRIEDFVVVTETGGENLTLCPKELLCLNS
ncbi:MAG: aminopeptidase P family protein [Oscillospiraceae bacterium]